MVHDMLLGQHEIIRGILIQNDAVPVSLRAEVPDELPRARLGSRGRRGDSAGRGVRRGRGRGAARHGYGPQVDLPLAGWQEALLAPLTGSLSGR